jgi:transcriptional regulator GlxA family with amidase domain
LTALLTELDAATQGETSPLLAGTHKYHYNAVIQTMQQILADPSQPLSVTELAESAGYSMEHFSRVFRKITGRSPQQYIIHARTVRACELLNHTSLSIAEIAAQLGYDSPYFFSRQFKQQTGVNPREGRQILSGADPQGRTLYASSWEWSQRNRPSSRDGFSNQSRERKQKIDKTTNPK